ncbi:monocarboxylate transporter 4 [Octopus bimaculoides]|uniref:Major facilitator superfamily (MFS) profile domain-containing protein n=1 Tax=Octopus bimaculoides TaxID=37653 RepID=A0A0L8G9F2_OCTBM|nr:monocarboxylate transporter 4 [Octopus bimaculoides]|eukprot:XP_014783055.1 PREDICTED: monocarboxylate transporter 4-like [Octopus bimaculoides]
MYIAACSVGYTNSFGVLYAEIDTYFKAAKEVSALAPGLCTALSEGAGILCTAMVNKIGTRYTIMIGGLLEMIGVFVSSFANSPYFLIGPLGVLAGTGACLAYVSIFIAIGQHFESVRIPNALISVGFTCGIFGLSKIMQILTEYYTWRGGLVIISGLLFNNCIAGLLLTNSKQKEKPILKKKKLLPDRLFDVSILKNFFFMYYVLVTCFVYSSLLIFVTFVVDYAREKGINEDDGANMLFMYGIGSIPGGFVAMVIMAYRTVTAWDVQAVCVVVAGVALALFPMFSTFESLSAISALLGIAVGMVTAVYTTVAMETLGTEKYSSGLGFTGTAMGAIMFTVSYTSGTLTEMMGSYSPAYKIFGWLTCALGGGMVIIRILQLVNKFRKGREFTLINKV